MLGFIPLSDIPISGLSQAIYIGVTYLIWEVAFLDTEWKTPALRAEWVVPFDETQWRAYGMRTTWDAINTDGDGYVVR